MDDQELKRDIQNGVKDPLVNLVEFEDKTLDEGFGTLNDKPQGSVGSVSQAMIKRFNQHSIMVGMFLYHDTRVSYRVAGPESFHQ